MSNPPPGPATAPTRSVCVSISACPPRTAELLLRNGLRLRCTAMVVVVPAGARRRRARKARPGRRGSCGGRAAHHAIVAMCDTADSLTWRVLAAPFHALAPSSGRIAYGRPAQCTCPPPFAASRPHLRNRGEAIRWPQSYDSHRSRRGNRRRSGPSQSAAGVNRTTSAGNPARNISFFSDTSHGDVS